MSARGLSPGSIAPKLRCQPRSGSRQQVPGWQLVAKPWVSHRNDHALRASFGAWD